MYTVTTIPSVSYSSSFSDFCFFFFNDTATTEIYTLSLHDALPISVRRELEVVVGVDAAQPRRHVLVAQRRLDADLREDRKSTRLNSSHVEISYAVFCLKKKKHRHDPPATFACRLALHPIGQLTEEG